MLGFRNTSVGCLAIFIEGSCCASTYLTDGKVEGVEGVPI